MRVLLDSVPLLENLLVAVARNTFYQIQLLQQLQPLLEEQNGHLFCKNPVFCKGWGGREARELLGQGGDRSAGLSSGKGPLP